VSVILSLPFLLCLAALGAALAIGASVLHDRRLPPRDRAHEPQHAASLPRRPVPSHARTAFADPRDASDPDGTVWLRSLKAPAWDAPEALRFRREAPPLALLEKIHAGLLALDVPGELEMPPPGPEPEPDPVPDPEPDLEPEPAPVPAPEPVPEPGLSDTAWTKAMGKKMDALIDRLHAENDAWRAEHLHPVPDPGASS